jgi:hypothetical protein
MGAGGCKTIMATGKNGVCACVRASVCSCKRTRACLYACACAGAVAREFFSFPSLQLHALSGVLHGRCHHRCALGIRQPDLRLRVLHRLSLSERDAAQLNIRVYHHQHIDRERVLFETTVLIQMPESEPRLFTMAVHLAPQGGGRGDASCLLKQLTDNCHMRTSARAIECADMQNACERAQLCIETQAYTAATH